MIGTVRHNGFIPWDDDIDIWMLGDDYDRFVEVFTKSTEDYYILSALNSPYYYNLMTRICSKAGELELKGIPNIYNLGPFIDIFRLYKAPENRDERRAFYGQIVNLNLDILFTLPFRYYLSLPPKRVLTHVIHSITRLKKDMYRNNRFKRRKRETCSKISKFRITILSFTIRTRCI